MQFRGGQQIRGDLPCRNATQLTALMSDNLTTIAGIFNLEGLTALSTLQFDELTGVNSISWDGLPALQALGSLRGISKANNVNISNTQLSTLEGFTLIAVGCFGLNNNPNLATVSKRTCPM